MWVVLHANIDEMVFKTCVCYSCSVSLITHFSGCCGSRLSCWRSWSPVCWQLEKLEGRGGRRPSPSQRRGRTWQSLVPREKIASPEASWSATKTSRPSSQAPWLCKLGQSKKLQIQKIFLRVCNNGKLEKMKTPFGFKSPRGLLPQCEYKVWFDFSWSHLVILVINHLNYFTWRLLAILDLSYFSG